jgi:hypothetical protein
LGQRFSRLLFQPGRAGTAFCICFLSKPKRLFGRIGESLYNCAMAKTLNPAKRVGKKLADQWPDAPWVGASKRLLYRQPVEQSILNELQGKLKPTEVVNGTIVGLETKELIQWLKREARGSESQARRILDEAEVQGWLGDKHGLKYTLTNSGSHYIKEIRPKMISGKRSAAGATPPRDGHAPRGRPKGTT